jgi:hypothetical protein
MSAEPIERGDYVEAVTEAGGWRGVVTGTEGCVTTIRVTDPRGSCSRRKGDTVISLQPELLDVLVRYEGGPFW